MKRNTLLAIAFAGLILLASASLASAWGPGGGRHMMGGWGGGPGGCPYAYGPAQLDQEKQDAVDKIMLDYRQKTADVGQKLYAKQAELEALLLADKLDEKRIAGLTSEINGLRATLFEAQVGLRKTLAKDLGLRGPAAWAGAYDDDDSDRPGGWGCRRMGW